MKILLYGSNGWIGSIFKKILENKTVDFICGKSRVDNKNDLMTTQKINPIMNGCRI